MASTNLSSVPTKPECSSLGQIRGSQSLGNSPPPPLPSQVRKQSTSELEASVGPLRVSGLNRDQPLAELGLSCERIHTSPAPSLMHTQLGTHTHTHIGNRPSLWGTFYGPGITHLTLTTDLPRVLSHLCDGIEKGRAPTYLPSQLPGSPRQRLREGRANA